MSISLIFAASENQVVGRDNRLPWHLPADLQFFKRTTMGHPIIMGRKTFESVGRPLPGRPNIVITRQQGYEREGIMVVSSLSEAIEKAASFKSGEIFITGGSEIFRQAMPLAQRIYLTRIHAVVEGDAYAPELETGQWELLSSEPHPADEKHAYAFTFEVWERKR